MTTDDRIINLKGGLSLDDMHEIAQALDLRVYILVESTGEMVPWEPGSSTSSLGDAPEPPTPVGAD